MQVDEALAFADEWIEGVTVYEGLQGWRVVCATLAAEVRRLRHENAELRKDAARLDWLADPENHNGSVQLPREIVFANIHSMRDAIDAAMVMPAPRIA